MQPWRTPFWFWTSLLFHVQLTGPSWPADRFLRRQVRCSGIPISFLQKINRRVCDRDYLPKKPETLFFGPLPTKFLTSSLNYFSKYQFYWDIISVQLLSGAQLFATPWSAVCQASLSFSNSKSFSNLCPLNWWCHPTTWSSVFPFPSRLPFSQH